MNGNDLPCRWCRCLEFQVCSCLRGHRTCCSQPLAAHIRSLGILLEWVARWFWCPAAHLNRFSDAPTVAAVLTRGFCVQGGCTRCLMHARWFACAALCFRPVSKRLPRQGAGQAVQVCEECGAGPPRTPFTLQWRLLFWLAQPPICSRTLAGRSIA